MTLAASQPPHAWQYRLVRGNGMVSPMGTTTDELIIKVLLSEVIGTNWIILVWNANEFEIIRNLEPDESTNNAVSYRFYKL